MRGREAARPSVRAAAARQHFCRLADAACFLGGQRRSGGQGICAGRPSGDEVGFFGGAEPARSGGAVMCPQAQRSFFSGVGCGLCGRHFVPVQSDAPPSGVSRVRWAALVPASGRSACSDSAVPHPPRYPPVPADLRGMRSAFSAARSLPGPAVRPCIRRRSAVFQRRRVRPVRAAFCAGSKRCSALRRRPRPMGGACACFGAVCLLRQRRSAPAVLSPYIGRPPSWPASRSAPATRKSMLPDSKTVSRGVWMRLRYSSPRRVRRRAATPMPRRKEA